MADVKVDSKDLPLQLPVQVKIVNTGDPQEAFTATLIVNPQTNPGQNTGRIDASVPPPFDISGNGTGRIFYNDPKVLTEANAWVVTVIGEVFEARFIANPNDPQGTIPGILLQLEWNPAQQGKWEGGGPIQIQAVSHN